MVLSKFICNSSSVQSTLNHTVRLLFSHHGLCRLHSRIISRTFARSSRSAIKNIRVTNKHDQKLRPWRKITFQMTFAAIFLFIVHKICIVNEIIDARRRHIVAMKEDIFPTIYSRLWTDILQSLGIRDTLFNRRIIQVAGLMTVCFLGSVFVKGIMNSQRLFFILGSGRESSFISPITSMFLHGSPLHLLSNVLGLYVLTIGWYKNGPPIHGSLDKISHHHLLFLLLLCGGMSSLVCNVRYAIQKSSGISVGFSAALYGLIMYQLSEKPNTRIGIIFLPKNTTFSAEVIRNSLLVIEFAILALAKYHRIDSFGHIAGLCFGYLYFKYGQTYWQYQRELFVKNNLPFSDSPNLIEYFWLILLSLTKFKKANDD